MSPVRLLLKYRLLFLFSFCFHTATARPYKDFQVVHYGDETLPQTSLSDITNDDNGYLWLCTQMGLVRFDGQDFRTYTPDNTPVLKNVRSQFFFRGRHNRLYYRDDSYTLYELHKSKLTPVKDGPWYLTTGFLMVDKGVSIFNDGPLPPDKAFYVDDHPSGLFTYALGTDTIRLQCKKATAGYGILNGRFFIVNRDHSFRILFPGRPVDKPVQIAGDLLRDPQWTDKSVPLSCFDGENKMFLRLGNTLYRLTLRDEVLYTTELITGLDIQRISCIHEDTVNDYLAIGSFADGLYMLYPKRFSTKLLHTSTNNLFYSIGHLKDNRFLSSFGIEFDLYTDYERKVLTSTPNSAYRHGNYLLKGSELNLKSINVKTGEVKTILKDFYKYGWFQKGLDDAWGRSWIAASGNLAAYDPVHNTLSWINIGLDSLYNRVDIIESFFLPDRNTIWIGSRYGLLSLDLPTRKSKPVLEMTGKYIRNFIDAGDGGIWVLTYGSGYYYYKSGRFLHMPADRNHLLQTVHTMLLDKKGFYWMSSNKGLFRVSRAALLRYTQDSSKEVRYEYFDKRCGFETNEFNGGCNPCGAAFSDSLFLLPSMNGLVHFNPLNIKTPPMNSPIYLDKILIDGKEVAIRNDYTLQPDFSSFYCEVSSPYYGMRDNLVLEYKIDGLNATWQPLINNSYLQFNRLPHGRYVIHMRKLTSFSATTYTEQQIVIRVATPVYFRPWFIAVLLLAIVFVSGLFVRLRLRILTRQKQKLEQQVEERTNQLARSLSQLMETVTTLEQSQAELHHNNRFKEQLTSIVLHDIQTPLRFLKRVVRNVQQTYRTLSPDKLGQELDELYYATAEVTDYSKDFLTWIKSQKETFRITPRRVVIADLLEEIGQLYQKIAHNVGATITIHCRPQLALETDPALLSIIIRNLTDNAIKYAPNGQIVLQGKEEQGQLIIRVADNGLGMTAEQVEALMADEITRTTIANGQLGYHLIKDLLRVLGGTLHIDSTPGKGTTVMLLFEVPKP